MPSVNKSLLLATKLLLTAAFLALGAWFVWARKDEFLEVQWPSMFAVAIVAMAFVVNVALRSTYNLITARKLGAHMSAGESFMLSAVVAAGNFILPAKVGAGLRALYMKRAHGFPISHFMSGVFLFLLVTVFFASLAALGLLAIIHFDLGYFRLDLVLLFPATMVLTIAALAVLRTPADTDGDAQTWLGAFRGGLATIVAEKKLVLAAFVIVAVGFGASALAWSVALREASPEIALVEAFLLAASQIITGFITLTPGAAGFQELAGMYVGKSFDATMAQIFAVLVWVRVVRVGVAVCLAIPSIWILRGRLGQADAQQRAADVKPGAS